jgi:predicted transcriptional regulator
MDLEKIANGFLEISSEQRLGILLKLENEKLTITEMAKYLDATVPEVHRNFTRLVKAGLIDKNTEGSYELTLYGKLVCIQVPSFSVMLENNSYFSKHSFGTIPKKFVMRLAELETISIVKGFVKVLEQWKEIHQNSKQYICNVLYEVPYSSDIIDTIGKKLEKGITIKSIFAENAIIPKERKKSFEQHDFKKFVQNNTLERRMLKDVNVVVLLNEKEACLILPNKNGEVDMSEMLYSDDDSFHEWCKDYFEDCWNKSTAFQEIKIKN